MAEKRIPVGDRVVIYQRGKKQTWVADFWHAGQHRRQSLKSTNKKVATQRAVELAQGLSDGTFRRTAKNTLIADAVKCFLEFLIGLVRRPRTITRYRGELHTLQVFCDANRILRLSQITPAVMDQYRAHRLPVAGGSTIHHEINLFKQLLKWCVSRDLAAMNPLRDYRNPKPRRRPQPAPTDSELQRILTRLTPTRRLQVTVPAFTGMRSSELQHLRVADVDVAGNWIHIVSRPGLETKNGESRKVPIHLLLRAALEMYTPQGSWYFTAQPSRKYPVGDHWLNTKKLNVWLQSVLKQLGLPSGRRSDGLVIHSMRRYFETTCVNAGIPQLVIDGWLGHKGNKSMAAVYYHLADEQSQAFIKRVPFGTGKPPADGGNTEVLR